MSLLSKKGKLWRFTLLLLFALLLSVVWSFSGLAWSDRPSDPSSWMGWYRSSRSALCLSESTSYVLPPSGSKSDFSWGYSSGTFSVSFGDGSSSLIRMLSDGSLYCLFDHDVFWRAR